MLIGWIVFLPFLSAPIAYILGRKNEKARDIFAAAVTGAVLLLTLLLPRTLPSFDINGILSYGLHFTTDGFRLVYACVTAIMWFGTTLFSFEYFKEEPEGLAHYWFFVLMTFGATEGVMLSADFMTAFVFFEILSFTSFTWVIHEETAEAIRAGYTYLFIAVIGGLVLFMGLLLLRHAAGTLTFSELSSAAAAASNQSEVFAAGICILIGFGAKAGMFPLHIWLPKAHPVAPSPASALLSGILTKVGIYGILMTAMTVLSESRPFGLTVLLLGVITMALGALLALFSVNLKRTLACSSMSQIGFILTGVGMYVLLTGAGSEEGAETALSGLMLHMTNHSLIKLTLFLAAGVVIMNLHTLVLDDIRGWGRNKTLLKIAFALGALGISGVPLFNGYISKTLLHEGIVEGIAECAGLGAMLHVIEWVFLASGGLTFAYMLKLFICIFVEKNEDPGRQAQFDASPRCMNTLSTAAIFGSSLFMIILGQSAVSTRLAAYMTGNEEILAFRAFIWTNLKGGLISLGIGAAVYLVLVRHVFIRNGSYVNLWPSKLDLEELVYRPLLTKWLPLVFGNIAAIFGENRILTPLAKWILGGAKELAALFGENKILRPLSRVTMFLMTFFGRALSDSMDALIVLFRRTLLREKRVRVPDPNRPGKLDIVMGATGETIDPLSQNFTFAMMMTCIGILLILGVLVVLVVL